ncbi:dTDP-4-dehydrorhamnose reductase [Amphritea sp. 2_MG-2023]|jgi:dTDP-4-dehydrorhamnose reductase|uniref:dTDP-4-dehydrorhamnose reductase n=1 Tax=Amphritea TaxID=515417 RepID=UPI001C06DACC|nr:MULTISPECIES: dTDP-4-dehydrorhamnose reductase [Amphritea]MBU2964006.1 dTDP-4-dehydrorhamnose reductase [Amphritea atlantica]MDO6420290.1 dTDP-4-dehydrorhamnose reductase [Amphritea sp. 2_MG-2023]MDX2422454.1 dTDP-4-dehydrorhamnose reductase [Amphritea sp.]
MTQDFLTTPAKILITGVDGQIGYFLNQATESDPFFSVVAFTDSKLDISSREQVQKQLNEHQPDYVINTTGFNAVDRAEANSERCFALNRDAVENLALACSELAIPLIHLSSDYVFDGHYESGYTEDDQARPLGLYGESKWQGEEVLRSVLAKHVILRVSWVFSTIGDNFMRRALLQARQQEEICAADDRRGCPTSASDIARVIAAILKQLHNGAENWGTYHYCCAEVTTRYGFTEAVLAAAGQYEKLKVEKLIPISSSDLGSDAERPASSVLVCTKLLNHFGIRQRPWRSQLVAMIREQYQNEEINDITA